MAHQHPVKDTDLHFVIDPVTRVVKNNSGKIVIMQHDHQSEILTFELPRYIDTHDMSLSNTVRVHYINIGSSSKYEPVSGVYEITDLQIDPENENLVTCSWTLTNNTTQLEGTLNFIIRFSCLTGDTIDYSWSTAIYSGITVAKTIDSSDYVMTAIPDILEQWKASLKGDPFTYDDFTPEQLEGLKGPAGIIISETEPTNGDHPVWVRPSGEYIVENLGLTGATVGQTVKIKAVDENGIPTEWEAADAASGEDEWTQLCEVELTEATNAISQTWVDTPMRKIKVSLTTLAASANTSYMPARVFTEPGTTATRYATFYPTALPIKSAKSVEYIAEAYNVSGNVHVRFTEHYGGIYGNKSGSTGGVVRIENVKSAESTGNDPYGNGLYEQIIGFSVQTYGTFEVGTKLKIWGVAL